MKLFINYLLMLVTVKNPEQKELNEKQLVSLAIKMFKNTLNT